MTPFMPRTEQQQTYMAPSLSPPVIELAQVSFAYPGAAQRLLDAIDLRVSPGERVGIIGGNGCGKSTISKLLLGIYPPSSGTVSLYGTPVSWTTNYPDVGYIGDPGHNAQELGLPIRLTVAELIDTYGALCRLKAPQTDTATIRQQLRLGEIEGRLIGHLSTGERKRVMAALVFMSAPTLLILDEPFDGLDVDIVQHIHAHLDRLLSDSHRTLLLISHSRIEIDTYADEVYRIQQQKLIPVVRPTYTGRIEYGSASESIEGLPGKVLGRLDTLLDTPRPDASLRLTLTPQSTGE